VSALVHPLAGESHLLVVRAAGAMRGYAAGFEGPGRLAIHCRDFGTRRLASADFAWECGRDYRLCLEAIGDRIVLSVDGTAVLETRDTTHPAGMVGCAASGPARALYGPFEVEELR